MGKKKGSRKQGSQAGDTDAASIASATTLSSVADLGFDDSSSIDDDPFEVSIDCLYEKRASTRERGLQNLVSLLARSFSYEEALVRKETLSSLMLGRIRKGSALEASLACRGVALLVVTLGAGGDAESLQQDAQPVLEQAACHGKGVSVKAAAIEALAVTTFVACNDPGVVDKCMTGFANLWKSGPAKVSSAAIRGWSLLLSTLPAWRMTTSSVEAWLQGLAKQLHSEDVEVRAAAGEAIALLYHSCGISDLESWLEDQEQSDSDSSPPESPLYNPNQNPQGQPHSPIIQPPENQHPSATVSTELKDGTQVESHDSAEAASALETASEPQTAASHQQSHHQRLQQIVNTQELSSQPGIVFDQHQSEPLKSASELQELSSQPGTAADQRHVQQFESASELQGPSSQPSTAVDHCRSDQLQPASQSSRDDAEGNAEHDQRLQLSKDHQFPSAAADSGEANQPQQPAQHSNQTVRDDGMTNGVNLAGTEPAGQLQCQNQDLNAAQPGVSHDVSSSHSASLRSEQAKTQVAEGESSQRPAKSKGGPQARRQTESRDPKQQAEAISNGLEDVVRRMKELATNRGDMSRRSRKDRASMRSTFRELCNIVEMDQ